MINRYAGEIRINPIAVLRNNDFNNDGEIQDIQQVLTEALHVNHSVSERITKLQNYLKASGGATSMKFNFAEGGYIALRGLSDQELLTMKSRGLIDLFDFATDKEWVKKYGHQFGLIWENGRAVAL